MELKIFDMAEQSANIREVNRTETAYFTPSIEDIRVGYEFEVKITNPNNTLHQSWQPYKVGDGYEDLKIGRVVEVLTLGLELRVPYLTREQIEKEGWEYDPVIMCYKREGYKLFKFSGDRAIVILKTKLLGKEEPVYEGECKDINTLRQLMKLLNIK